MTQPGSRTAGGWKALLICPNRTVRAELLPLLAQFLPVVPVLELDGYPDRIMLAQSLTDHGANLALLDVSTDPDRGVALIAELLELSPSLLVVVLMSGKEPDLLRCLRMGASEFLVSPLTAEQFQAATERLSKLRPTGDSRAGQARVYCVMPAKGACGASTIACNMAYQAKRLGAKRILLADLDPLTGTQGFLLKLKSPYSFVDAVTRAVTLDGDVWRALVNVNNGVDVLLSPENPVDALQGGQDATTLVEFARQNYEAVVLDAGGAYGSWSLSLARLCDELLLVATNELPALQATQRVLSYFDQNQVDRSKVRLVINRFNREVGLSREMIETALHTDIFHVLPSDYEAVQRALIEGKLISGGSSFGKSLLALVDRLGGNEDAPRRTPARTAPPSGFGGLFSKILRRG